MSTQQRTQQSALDRFLYWPDIRSFSLPLISSIRQEPSVERRH